MTLGLVMLRGLGSAMMTVNLALITKYAKEAGVSPAVMLSITAMSSFFVAVAFYFIYHEKLLMRHMIGMSLIISSVIITAVSKSTM